MIIQNQWQQGNMTKNKRYHSVLSGFLLSDSRCGKDYFPLTMFQHIELLKSIGFSKVHIFWISYMQMGIYAIN